MPTGNYTVTGELSGFKKVSLANVHLGVDQKVRRGPQARHRPDVGAVTIQAETPLIQTNSSELGTTSRTSRSKPCPSTAATSSA
jgi:hypothetical protein